MDAPLPIYVARQAYAPAEPAITGIRNRYFANQSACGLHNVHWEFHSTETPKTTNANLLPTDFIIRNPLTHSGRSHK
jgi:hypothetical protein